MQHRELKLNGVIGYWSLVDGTPLDVVHDGLKPAGLSHCVPVEMTDKPSLRRALATVYPGRRQLIRPLEGKAGFAVIHESTDDSGDMVHEQQMQVLIIYPSHMGGEAYLVFRPADHFLVQRVRDEFDKEKGKVPASQMGQILVRCVEELKGVSLRPSGGFYWLAEEDVPKWEQVCDVIESAALAESIESGDLGKRALQSRETMAQELDEYLQRYEGIFQRSFDELRARADEVEATAALALMQALSA